jgi:hypothetical protein
MFTRRVLIVPLGFLRHPVAPARYLLYSRHIILLVTLLVFLGSPSHGAQHTPTITSLIHQRIVGGDSFRLVADGPIPKAYIESENNKLKIEFKGLDCRLPEEYGGHFITPIKGKLVDQLEINIEGTPAQTKLTLRLTNGADYSYYYIKKSAEDIELLIIAPDKEAQTQPPMEIPKPQEPKVQPPPPPPSAPPSEVQKESGLPGRGANLYYINKVEYFTLDEYGDRFVFSFDGATRQPEIKILDYPLRLEITFAESEALIPSKNKYEAFLTPVPGRGINQLKAWNRNLTEAGAVLELILDQDMSPKWVIEQVPPNKIRVDISYEKPPAPPEKIFTPPVLPEVSEKQPSGEIEVYSISGLKPGKELESTLEEQMIKLNETELELTWPKDAEQLIGQLKQMTAGLGPGVFVEIPLKLRLHLEGTGYAVPYPEVEP